VDLRKKQKLDLILGNLLLFFLRIPVRLLGLLLRRDHSLDIRGDILFIKMQGGGSLVIAYPALLAIRKRFRNNNMLLLTTPALVPFAESLDVFDDIIVIKDGGLPAMILSALSAWRRTLRADTVIDLEVYSKLTTVFSVITAARNRIGFYLESIYWRKGLHTHLVFFNRFSGSYFFYDEIARLLGAEIPTRKECEEHFRRNLPVISGLSKKRRISIGHACSEMGAERMLSPAQWLKVFSAKRANSEEYILLGSKADYEKGEEIINLLRPAFPNALFINYCGTLSLMESISWIDSSDEFWAIDSALLHYARLLGKKNVSFWGPTDPNTRLKSDSALISEVYYHKVPCSPCIHVAESPPCCGKNVCIGAIFDPPQGQTVRKIELSTRLK
jgi:ADP-heptose:LPS heptosyltransferase